MELAARYRSRFLLPENTIYLDGNSLGPLSRDAEAAVLRSLDEWKTQAIHGWTEGTHPWLFLADRVAQGLAPLLGAQPQSIIAMGSITSNLHQLIATLYTGQGKLLCEHGAFPTDRYALQSHGEVVLVEPDEDTIESAFASGEIALAVLPSVLFTTGRLLDMPRLTRAGQRAGVIVLWDLAHSMGILPHALDVWGCDGAFWCHYKWLSAGPGAVAGLYLNPRHHDKRPGLAGWFGTRQDRLFANSETQELATGAARLQQGTPHVLSLAPVEAAVALTNAAGIDAIRAESLALTALLRAEAERAGFEVVTPSEDTQRGGHITIRQSHAAPLCRILRRHGIVPDHRPPNLIRFAPNPLFNTAEECVVAIATLTRLFDAPLPEEPTNTLVP